MENDDIAKTVGLLALFLSLILGVLFGSYKYGRIVERRLLTSYFAQMTLDTYEDGNMDGYKKGFIAGKKAREKELAIEDEQDRDSFSGHY